MANMNIAVVATSGSESGATSVVSLAHLVYTLIFRLYSVIPGWASSRQCKTFSPPFFFFLWWSLFWVSFFCP